MDFKRAMMAVVVTCFLMNAQASDPVSWSLSPSTGFPAVKVGSSASVIYTLTNRLPQPATLDTRFVYVGGNFNIFDECKNKTLAPRASCSVTAVFAPVKAGNSSMQFTYGYHNNRIPLPLLSATGVGQSAGEQIQGTISGLPPAFTLSNPQQQPEFSITYTNVGFTDVTGFAGNPGITATPGTVATVAVLPGSDCGTVGVPKLLHPGDFCTIRGKLTPVALGQLIVSGLFTYDGGTKTSTPTAHTSVISGSGSCIVHAYASLPLPASTFQYSDNVVGFTLENECDVGTAAIGQVSIDTTFSPSSGNSAITTLLPQFDKCSNQILAPAQSCLVLASVIPQTAGAQMNVSISAPSGATTANASTSAPVRAPGYAHNVTFINQCKFAVWYGVANDNTTNKQDPTSPAGPNDYLLAPQVSGAAPATKTITFPGDYLGLFFPRTGCQNIGNQLICSTGQCQPSAPPNGGQCNLGNEPVPPYTKLEMNFFNSAQSDGSFDGDYDVSLIEGFNIPVEMKAFGPAAIVNPYPPANNSAFQCTGAGAPIQAAGSPLGICPWVVTPPSTNNMEPRFFNFVSDGDSVAGETCNCSGANPTCGIAFKANNPEKGNLIMSCGTLLGTWALKTLCTQQYFSGLLAANNPKTHFNCTTALTPANFPGIQSGYSAGTTLSDLYGCVFNGSISETNLNSCYKSTSLSTSYCCGATDWNVINPYVTAQDKQSLAQNPDWGGPSASRASTIIPSPYESIVWYKNACPTAYSYPFDDHSTSFYCKQSSPGNNVKMDYQVVFCPGGLTG